jgi:thiamine pyrophosphokinase
LGNFTETTLAGKGWFFMCANRAVIFANGLLNDLQAVRSLLQDGDYLVAADGGLHHLKRLGLEPALLVGDFDSTSPEEVAQAEGSGARILRYRPEKDETDLELALRVVLDDGYKTIRIIGGLGGRLDHALGNIFLLTSPEALPCDIRLDDGQLEVFVIHGSAIIAGNPGEIVSLLPLGGPARGVVTDGLRYPLHGETLWPDKTRGISNIMSGVNASVILQSGYLLCIHQRQIDSTSSTGG